jgi:hypothetical protein
MQCGFINAHIVYLVVETELFGWSRITYGTAGDIAPGFDSWPTQGGTGYAYLQYQASRPSSDPDHSPQFLGLPVISLAARIKHFRVLRHSSTHGRGYILALGLPSLCNVSFMTCWRV